MLCGMIPKMKKKNNSVPVYLNVYDLIGFTPINDYAYWLGLGVYHSGVEVHGVEYGFEGNHDATTGVFEVEPKQCPGFMFRKSILIGRTDLSAKEVDALVDTLANDYVSNTYHLLRRNCNHFSKDLCKLLTGKPIPRWVNRVAQLGRLCKCVFPAQPDVSDEVKIYPISGENKILDADERNQSCLLWQIKHDHEDGNFKVAHREDEELVLDDAVTEIQSHQQDLQPADGTEPGRIEAEAEIREQSDLGAPERHGYCQDPGSFDSEAAEKAGNQIDVELTESELDMLVLENIDNSDEELAAEVNGTPETLTTSLPLSLINLWVGIAFSDTSKCM
ncbi:hypothetical protein RDABS01_019414 [Bienertia sinuspersici]